MTQLLNAEPEDEAHVRSAVAWNRRRGEHYGGLHYEEELAGPEGVSVLIFVTDDTTATQMAMAAHAARDAQDVVRLKFLWVPKAWLESK